MNHIVRVSRTTVGDASPPGEFFPGSAGERSLQDIGLRGVGRITLQRLNWLPVCGNPFGGDEKLLAVTLDLLASGQLGPESSEVLRELWPGSFATLLLYGENWLLAPQLDREIRNSIESFADSVSVSPQIQTMRVDTGATDSYDSLKFSAGLPLGDKLLIFGVAFREKDNCNDQIGKRFTWALSELINSQSSLSPLNLISGAGSGDRDLEPNNPAQALVNCASGKIIWRNAAMIEDWSEKARVIEKIFVSNDTAPKNTATKNTPPKNIEPETENDLAVALALVTIGSGLSDSRLANSRQAQEEAPPLPTPTPTLRDGWTSRLSDDMASGRLKDYPLSAPVQKNLSRLVASSLSEIEMQRADSNSSGLTAADAKNDVDLRQESETDAEPGAEKETLAEDKISNDGRRSLEIALSYLPAGGRLKLSSPDTDGRATIESQDQYGEEFLSMSLKAAIVKDQRTEKKTGKSTGKNTDN